MEEIRTVEDLAQVIRALRRREARRRGQSTLTYRELAAKTGWSRGIIGEYFAGHVLPPTDRFDVLLQLLGASPGEQGSLATARDRVEELRRSAPAPAPAAPSWDPAAFPCPYLGLSAFREQDAALFRGRDELAERLVSMISRKPVVAVVGPSGSGKSSLVFAGAASRLRASGLTITTIRPSAAGGWDPDRPGVLVVDQFEELYATQGPAEASLFVDELVRPVPGRHVVVTLRTDFLGHALDHVGLAQHLQDSTVVLGRMTREQLGRAIEGPLPEQVAYEAGLVERILADVGAEAGSLALLEFTLTLLWERGLTHAAYDELGGVAAALGRYAEDVYQRDLQGSEPSVSRLFSQLVWPAQGTKRVARRHELDPALWPVAERLAGSRLAVIDRSGAAAPEGSLELVHEALISEWPRLRGWVDADRDFRGWQERLRAAMRQYEGSGRDHGALLRGVPLAEALEWRAERGADLSPGERAYIDAGRAVEGRTVRRLQVFVAGLVVLLAVASGLAVGGERQRRQLRENERLATSEALAAQADATALTRPVPSILLSLQAYNEAPTVDARGSLLRHLVEHSQTEGFLIGHTSRVSAVAYSPDGRTVATASVDGTARLWDAATHTQVAVLTGHTNWLRTVAFSHDGRLLATAGDDRTIRLWDVRTRSPLAVLTGSTAPVRSVAFSPDDRTLATAGDDKVVRLWDVAGRRNFATLTGHTDAVRSVAFSPDGKTLATASFDATVRLWDLASRRSIAVLTGHLGWVMAVAFSPDGRFLASAGEDRTARLWDVSGRRAVAVLTGHTDLVLGVAFSPDGRTLATVSADQTARLWNVSSHLSTATLTGHSGWVTGVAFSPDGRTLATASDDLTARIWYTDPHRGLTVVNGPPGITDAVGFSPDGHILATGGFDGIVRLWDAKTRTQMAILAGHTDKVDAVAFSPDGRLLATVSDDETVRLWDVAGRRAIAVLRGHTNAVRSVAFSPDGRVLATASNDRTVRLWNVLTHEPIAVLTGHTNRVIGLAFSPDGQVIASVSDDRTVRLWDVGGHRELAVLTGHTDKVSAVAFSPDGRTLATAGEDSTVRLWDVATRRSVAVLTGHTGWIWSVAFSPDGTTLATAADDGTIRLWDTPTRRALATLAGYNEDVPRVAFGPDGQTLAALAPDTTIRLWTMNTPAWQNALCTLAARNLTPAEWDEFLPGHPYQRTC